ncbi:MAG TPA: DUF6542 domain-containing protein [Nocardioidaceae bacterium]|nr:DUF6542 domain-containing protein [Nocardioidaceae bacterium]
MSNGRTLWEEGRQPGRQVVTLAVASSVLVVALDLLMSGRLTLFYDLSFVVVCIVAALAVRPRDFFAVGVLPPLLMFATVTVLALLAPGAVAEPGDGLIQAVVSGLAHRAGGLVAGYALTLGILALRQLAMRNAGRIRGDRRDNRSHALP